MCPVVPKREQALAHEAPLTLPAELVGASETRAPPPIRQGYQRVSHYDLVQRAARDALATGEARGAIFSMDK